MKDVSNSHPIRYSVQFAVLFILYFSTAKFGLQLNAVSGFATLFWPPTGISLALVFLWGYRVWPAIFLAAMLVNMTVGATWAEAFGIGVGNTLEAVVGVYLLRRFTGKMECLSGIRSVFVFIFYGAFLSTIISPTVGALSLSLGGKIPFSAFNLTWITWWIGDVLGNLIVAPLILVWSYDWSAIKLTFWRAVEIVALCVSLIGASFLIFWKPEEGEELLRAFYVTPFLVWACIRFGQKGGVVATATVAVIASAATLKGIGPFQSEGALQTLFALDLFLMIKSCMILVLGGYVTEIQKINEELDQKVLERTRSLFVSEQKFRAVAESAKEAIITGNAQGIITYFSPGAEQMFGEPAEAMVGEPLTVLMPDRYHEAHKKGFAHYLKTGEGPIIGKMVELFAKKNDGTEFPIELSLTVSPLDNELLFTAVIRDVTIRHQMEEELQRSNESLNQFARVASHDLQEPLRMVINYMQLLQRKYGGKLDKEADEFIQYAVQGALTLRNLVQNWLAYASLGKEVEKERIDCEAVLKAVLDNLKLTIKETAAVITHDPLPSVFANETHMIQLLQNLIGNGIKFHGEKPPRVHIGAKRQGEVWVFSVRDEGIGIDPQYFERIFILSQRLHTAQEYPGTGMGLSICKKIVEMYGGRIWVESEAGKGATFYFTIPIVKEEK